jgi:hypothetical protein
MPANVVQSKEDEALWRRAKKLAQKQNPKDLYALTMHIFQNMKKADEREHDFAIDKGGEESAADRRERNAKPEHRAARREYMKTPEGRAANRKAQENYRAKHPERVAAQHTARSEHGESSTAGHECAVCGKPAIHKHHTDYGDPRRVRWLCHEHHVKAHHPKSNLGEKSMHDVEMVIEKCGGPDVPWFERYAGTPFYVEAMEIERDHVVAPPNDEDDAKYHAARGRLRAKHLSWRIREQKKREAAAKVAKAGEHPDPHEAPPKKHRETGATESSDYADPTAHRYPIHREANVRAAISYFSMPRNYGKYGSSERAAVWGRIMRAAKRFGIEVDDTSVPGSRGEEKKEKSMSDELFEAIMQRDPFSTEAPMMKAKDDDRDDGDGDDAENGDAKRLPPWLRNAKKDAKKAEKALREARDAVLVSKSMRKALSSAAMVDHPRPGATSTMSATDGDPGRGTTTVPMVDHPRPGGGSAADMGQASKAHGMPHGVGVARPKGASTHDIDDEVAEADEKALKSIDAALKSLEALSGSFQKALSTKEEMGDGTGRGGGQIGAAQTSADLARAPGDIDGSPFGSLGSMNGMPSVGPGATEMWSEDDRDVESQMSDGKRPLEQSVPSGSAGLESSVRQVMGGDVSAGGGGVEKSIARHGALGAQISFENEAARAQIMAKGGVVYSNAEDNRIAALMAKSDAAGFGGTVLGEPNINHQLPLTQTRECGFCKSLVPAMFATCPECGGDHSGLPQRSVLGAQSVFIEKSVKDSVRGPRPKRLYAPDGFKVE